MGLRTVCSVLALQSQTVQRRIIKKGLIAWMFGKGELVLFVGLGFLILGVLFFFLVISVNTASDRLQCCAYLPSARTLTEDLLGYCTRLVGLKILDNILFYPQEVQRSSATKYFRFISNAQCGKF